jgi:hypothetical protein
MGPRAREKAARGAALCFQAYKSIIAISVKLTCHDFSTPEVPDGVEVGGVFQSGRDLTGFSTAQS